MASDLGERIRRARKSARMTQDDLAKQIGVSPQAVSQWERGETIPDTRNVPTLARMLRVDPGALLQMISHSHGAIVARELERAEEPPPDAKVPVVGYVGAGSAAHYYAVSQGDLDEAPAPRGYTPKTVAVEVRGDSLGPTYNRWYVYYDDVRSPVTHDLIGRLCVVGLPDDRVLIKRLHRGKVPGTFDLKSDFDEDILGVTVDWAAKVKTMAQK